MSAASVVQPELEFDEPSLAKALRLPSGTAMLLLRKIVYYAEKIDRNTGKPFGYVVIKVQTFMEWLNLTAKRYVYRLLKQLEDYGLIERVPNPGHETAIYPLIRKRQIPGWQSHRPRPIRPRQKPMLEEVPQTRMPVFDTPADSPAPESVPGTDSASVNSPARSPLRSPLKASHYPYIKTGNGEKQQAQAGKDRKTAGTEPQLPAEAAPVVALLEKCGVFPEKIPALITSIGTESLTTAFSLTIRRIEKGLTKDLTVSDCAAYGIWIAQRLKLSEFKLPGWFLDEQKRTERRSESERAHANRVQTAPGGSSKSGKRPMPADWLPGVAEGEAIDLWKAAVELDFKGKHGSRVKVDYFSDEIRDYVRQRWQKRHPGKTVPWSIPPTEGGTL